MKTKRIRITEKQVAEVTFEDIFPKFQSICDRQAYKWSRLYEYPELKQEAYISLWKAFEKYENPEILFAAWATVFIKRGLFQYHVKNKSKCSRATSQIRSVISLYQPLSNGRGETFEIADVVGEEETFSESVLEKILVEKSMKRLNPQEKETLMKYVGGYSLVELSSSSSSYRQIYKRITNAKLKFRIQYIKECIAR